jgi:hypothetical protein
MATPIGSASVALGLIVDRTSGQVSERICLTHLRQAAQVRFPSSVPSTQGAGAGASQDAQESDNSGGIAARLGLQRDHLVQEVGFDDDCDTAVRTSLEAYLEEDLLDESTDEIVDAVVLWWREFDGDLVDALVDAIGPLADHGSVILFTPKPGRDGHVTPSDIADAAPTAGLQQTSTYSVGPDWQGTRLVAPRSGRR